MMEKVLAFLDVAAMFTALTYALTSTTVALVVMLAARERHVCQAGAQTFKYPKLFRWLFLIAMPGYDLMGIYASHTTPASRSRAAEMLWTNILFGLATLGTAAAYLWVSRFAVTLAEKTIVVTSFRGIRRFALDDVRQMVLLEGFRGAKDLSLYDAHDEKLLSVGGTIQDFDELIALLKTRLRHSGIVFKRRDRLGKWTEAKI